MREIEVLTEDLHFILDRQTLTTEDFKIIANILNEGVKLSNTDFIYTKTVKGYTAVFVAAEYGNANLLNAIFRLQNDATAETQPTDALRKSQALEALCIACARGHDESVAIILKNNTQDCFYKPGEAERDFASQGFDQTLNIARNFAINVCSISCVKAIIEYEKSMHMRISQQELKNSIFFARKLHDAGRKYRYECDHKYIDTSFVKITHLLEAHKRKISLYGREFDTKINPIIDQKKDMLENKRRVTFSEG